MIKEHENLYNLLIIFDDICKANDITYYLAGGSALGALRNHCFLPWDDDIDLYITRANWEKLRNLVETKPETIPDFISLVYVENKKYHRNPIARFVDTRTTTIYPAQSFSGETCGQQVELFILDPLPTDPSLVEEFKKYQKVYIELLTPYFIANKNASVEEFEGHFKLYDKYYQKCLSEGYDSVMNELEDKLFNYSEDDCTEYALRWGQRFLIHKKEYYEQTRNIVLEDREFPVAYKLEHAMRVDYGDSWMYVPSGDGQIQHNPLVVDINRSFKEYTKEYIPHINRENMVRLYTEKKYKNMVLYPTRRKIEMLSAQIRALSTETRIKHNLSESISNLYTLLDDCKFDELNTILNEYYEWQLRKNFRRYNVLLDMGDEFLYVAVMNYIMQGKYFTANGLLNIRKSKGVLSEKLNECDECIKVCRALSIAIYDFKDIQMVENLLADNKDKYSNLIDYVRAKLWLMEKNAKSLEDFSNMIEYGEKAKEKYPFDGEIIAYLASAYLKNGKYNDAVTLFDEAVHKTRNGIVWQKVKDAVGIDRMKEEAGENE